MSITFSTDLSDGDLATVLPFAARRRATTTVSEAELQAAYAEADAKAIERAKYRADLVTRYVQARGNEWQELRLLAEAAKYDKAHPGEPSLYDELHGTALGAAA